MNASRPNPVNGSIGNSRSTSPSKAAATGDTGGTLSARPCGPPACGCWGASFKYHRPRGIFSLSGLDCNALAEARDSTNLRMDTTLVEPGMEVRAVNTWGGVRSDLYRFAELFSPFLPVGFYYKAFHRPRSLFPFFERRMRGIAGLGNIHPDQPLRATPKRYDFCDLLVVGSGPAGLSAAIAAAELGLQVLLVEEDRLPGGTLGFQLPGEPEAGGLLAELLGRAAALPNLEMRTGTTAAGCYADRWVALIDSRRLTKLRARSLVVAAGCYDQPAVFRNNDLPGVMMASAAQRLIHQYAVKPFRQAVVLAANTDGYRAAVDLHRAGVEVALLSDLRPQGEGSAWRNEVAWRRIPIRTGTAVHEAVPAPGKRAIRGALLCPLDGRGDPLPEESESIACDGIAMSVGWSPADGILRQAGARMGYDESLEQYLPDRLPEGVFAAGRVNGMYPLGDQLEDGRRAGRQAAVFLGTAGSEAPAESPRRGPAFSHPYPVVPHPRGKNFVDLDEDIQLDDIRHSLQEGFDSAELLKRYSTLGMGPSQGKHSNLNGSRIPGPSQGRVAGGDRADHLPALHQPGALEPPGRAHLQPPAPNPHPRPPPATGRPFHGRGELAAAGILPGPRGGPECGHPGGSPGRSLQGRSGRRGHPGQAGNLRTRRRGIHREDVHGQVCQAEGGEKPLPPDVRRERHDGG